MTAREMIDNYQLVLASGDRIKVPAAYASHIEEIKAAKPEILTAFAEIANERRYPDWISYSVYSDTAYGIYNGFDYDSDPVRGIVEDAGLASVANHLDTYDYQQALQCYRHWQPLDELMAYYAPYGIDLSWRTEYKAAVQKQIDNRTAPGQCKVPYAVAKRIILDSLRRVIREKLPGLIAQTQAELDRLDGATVYETYEEARAAKRRWNDIENEGGGGFVPHYYTRPEVEHLRRSVEEMSAMLADAEASMGGGD